MAKKRTLRNEDRKRIIELWQKGFSFREVGEELDWSHQTVKKVVDESGASQTLFFWAEGEPGLNRSQLQSRLRKYLRDNGWDRIDPRRVRAWEERLVEDLMALAVRPEALSKLELYELGTLLATGPRRCGGKLKKDRSVRLALRSRREVLGLPRNLIA